MEAPPGILGVMGQIWTGPILVNLLSPLCHQKKKGVNSCIIYFENKIKYFLIDPLWNHAMQSGQFLQSSSLKCVRLIYQCAALKYRI